MTILDSLTALEREQLRYIAEHVEAWPEGHGSIWVSSVGWIAGSDPQEDGYLFESIGLDHPTWPTYSPDFTRAQYGAKKAELSAENACSFPACGCPIRSRQDCRLCQQGKRIVEPTPIDYRAHCEALAEACEAWVKCNGPSQRDLTTLLMDYALALELTLAALTRWKEEGK